VIWALSVLIVLAMVFGRSTSPHVKATRNAVDNARAEMLADAGVELALLDLSRWRAGGEARFPRSGRPVGCTFGTGERLVVVVEDEVGKVDLNLADETLVEAALIAAGMDPRQAERLAHRILDYRDSDDQRRPSGAEAGDYREAGRSGPKNRLFDAIEEVEQVLGAPAGLAEAIRPYATIYSGQQTIDPSHAPPRLAAALATRGGAAMELEAAARERDRAGSAMSRGAPAAMAGAAGGRAFRVLAEAHAGQRAVFVREAIVEFAASRPEGTLVRRWRRGDRLTGASAADAALAEADALPC
jgi:general secretion pathway protein K